MSSTIMIASASITAALVFYTLGVFGERRARTLNGRFLSLFWLGLLFDSTGTAIMAWIANNGSIEASPLHGITGGIAIALMIFHALWATFVVVSGSDKAQANFHSFSVAVWLLWLIPYCIGAMIGIPAINVSDETAVVISCFISFVIGCFLCVSALKAQDN